MGNRKRHSLLTAWQINFNIKLCTIFNFEDSQYGKYIVTFDFGSFLKDNFKRFEMRG